jgi:hypothetical protein
MLHPVLKVGVPKDKNIGLWSNNEQVIASPMTQLATYSRSTSDIKK